MGAIGGVRFLARVVLLTYCTTNRKALTMTEPTKLTTTELDAVIGRPAGYASPAHMAALDRANQGRVLGEQTWHVEGDAHTDQANLIRSGHSVSMVAFDASRGLYAFDVLARPEIEPEGWPLSRGQWADLDTCPLHGAECEAWA